MAILYSFDIKAKILSLSLSLSVPSFYPFHCGLRSPSQFPLVLPMFLPLLSVSLFRSPPFFVSLFFLPRCVQCLGSLTLAPRKSYGRNYHTAGIIIRVYASVSLCRYDYPAFSSLLLSFFFLIFWFCFFLFLRCFLLSLPYFRFSLSPFRHFFSLPRSLFCARVQAFSRRFFPPFSFFFLPLVSSNWN